jgi:hypothetical protein
VFITQRILAYVLYVTNMVKLNYISLLAATGKYMAACSFGQLAVTHVHC